MGLPAAPILPVEVDSFSMNVLSYSEKLEYRRITSFEDFEEMGRLRGTSYNKNEFFKGFSPDVMLDDIDFQPWSYCFGVYYDGALVATIRLQHITKDHRDSPAVDYFPDVVHPLLDQGMSFIVPGRFATSEEAANKSLDLPLMTGRLSGLALRYFKADAMLSLIKKGHAAYHRRFLRATQITELRNIDELSEPIMLYSTTHENAKKVRMRYPFFDGLHYEDRLLFGAVKPGEPAPLTILPTANQALGLGRLLRA